MRGFPAQVLVLLLLTALGIQSVLHAAGADEFKIKREAVFEFSESPVVIRSGDRIEVRFAAKGRCDVTVAVEDANGNIVRHLASGVLGDNAPAPFAKGVLKQALVWDGKDDTGKYIDDKDSHAIRVSLGLKPQYEKDLLYSPYRRVSNGLPVLAATPEGMLVYDGLGVDIIRLFGHDGAYKRTVYPFPADKIEKTQGLHWGTFPQDGKKLPLREGHVQATLLSSGSNAGFKEYGIDKYNNYLVDTVGRGASALAASGSRVAVVGFALNRLDLDGSTGGLPLGGAKTRILQHNQGLNHNGFGGTMPGGQDMPIGPGSVALSPDGKWVYLTNYVWAEYVGSGRMVYPYLHGVAKVPFEEDGEPVVFAGKLDRKAEGAKPGEFNRPVAVACDSAGRVYVADQGNNRVQVFAPDGKFLKNFAVQEPVHIAVHPKTGEVYVVSADEGHKALRLSVFGAFEKLERKASASVETAFADRTYGQAHALATAVDSLADPPTLWVAARTGRRDSESNQDLKVFAFKEGKLELLRDFAAEAKKVLARLDPPSLSRQRLVVNPKTGDLWVLEGDGGTSKAVLEPQVIDPETGKQQVVTLPHDCEDLAFDINGLAYLRGLRYVTRWETKVWREVPWDYGEERDGVNMNNETGKKRRASVLGGLSVPVRRYNHQGGLWVSAKGNLGVCSFMSSVEAENRGQAPVAVEEMRSFTPQLFPGRSAFGLVSVWDKHGQLVKDDALQGLSFSHGLGLDCEDNIYVMLVGARVINGERYWNHSTDTVVKFPLGRGRILTTHKIAPVPLAEKPKRDPDIVSPGGGRLDNAWVECAEWFYGGVGYQGRNESAPGYGCECWNSRFTIDYFARTFAPEVDHYSVAVLDTAGNLILRVGQYGNADSAGEKSAVPLDGDGVGLFYAPYVATQSDRRLYIADPGNRRIVSVWLGYHEEKRVALKDVPDAEAGK
ncbi:MAG: hypothetical protein L6R28_11215 [Planctomycetes bacterium]|nr:hypothetical protein [Planctomycetota bacterium]